MHLPQIGASRLKLERKPEPHWKHFRLYICPFGFQRLKMLIMIHHIRSGTTSVARSLVIYYSTSHTKTFQCTSIKWYWTTSQTRLGTVYYIAFISALSYYLWYTTRDEYKYNIQNNFKNRLHVSLE